eukprot:CAMPEP_0180275342 /NCGR_PEP_ID=MMETSP0988-20121125/5794_1 /TAXON_ID=697907 /ORGANISM="non described non described, Strain CCMP2293" /LENGTH=62 /DNA_ID=CAMNT_0022246607 /DNA_START=193 /DNA_END=381 /DNA_ORIENTATION=+
MSGEILTAFWEPRLSARSGEDTTRSGEAVPPKTLSIAELRCWNIDLGDGAAVIDLSDLTLCL